MYIKQLKNGKWYWIQRCGLFIDIITFIVYDRNDFLTGEGIVSYGKINQGCLIFDNRTN